MALTALVLIPLLVLSALAIDVGGFYARTSRMQRAADAAALAGVVWMPDLEEATDIARATAAKNGFAHDPSGTGVTVAVSSPGEARLRVEITAKGDLSLGSLVSDGMVFKREAIAEYVLPVPLGSPRNYFGTGVLNTGTSENLWLSVNPWCTDKVDGDRHQSRYSSNRPYSSQNCPSPVPPSSPILNTEYRPTGYELYVEVPPGPRAQDIEILVFDGKYSPGSGSPDNQLYTGAQNYTFSTFAADTTALDDSDNPPVPGCTVTYTSSSAFTPGINYLGSTRWNRLCTIPAGALGGRYIVRVANTPGQRYGAGANNYSIVAKYGTGSYGGTGSLCDARTDTTCPKVYGKDAISVYASQSSSTARFFLSEISPLHEGKQLQITLFDPGEGGNNIRIRRPTSTGYAYQVFDYTSSSGYTDNNVSSLSVTGSRFNGHTVQITVDLTGYSPPANNRWWQIEYNFGSGSVTDRTTWSVVIVGDPVHLEA